MGGGDGMQVWRAVGWSILITVGKRAGQWARGANSKWGRAKRQRETVQLVLDNVHPFLPGPTVCPNFLQIHYNPQYLIQDMSILTSFI